MFINVINSPKYNWYIVVLFVWRWNLQQGMLKPRNTPFFLFSRRDKMCARKDFHILLFLILHVCLFMTLVEFFSTNTVAELLNAIVLTNYGTKMLTHTSLRSTADRCREENTITRFVLTRGDKKCRLLRSDSDSAWHCSNGGGGASAPCSTCHDETTATTRPRRIWNDERETVEERIVRPLIEWF